MKYTITGTYRKLYSTKQYDTFDKIAHELYGEYGGEKVASYIIDVNPEYADVLIFGAGVKLYLPRLERAETSTLPKWKGGA